MLAFSKQENSAFTRLQILLIAVVTIFIFSLLLWDYYHGGVPAHHLLNRQDLPAISSWWGALVLPILAWIATVKIKKRLIQKSNVIEDRKKENNKISGLFFAGLIVGLLIAISFTYNYQPFLDNVLYILLILALIVPVYYSEFILGFVLGMTYTFGAILPTAFILVIAAVGFLLFKFIRPLFIKLIALIKK